MLLRLGELRLVVASSATAAREVMKTHDAAFAKRPRTTTINAITRNGVGIVYAPQDEQWRQVRKLCVNELLSPRQVRSLQATREAEAVRLVAALASAVGAEPVNFSSHILTYVNDVVVRAVVGDRMTDRDAFLECLDEGIKVATGFTLADLFPSSRLARAFSRTSRRVEAVVSDMKRIMDGVIDEHLARRSSKEEEEDLLDVLLRIQTDGGLQVPLEAGTIRAMITVS
jgi:cytochrome P450